MKNSYKMFLILAEELNFTRAAQRAYVSQQAMSDNIKRLEDEFGPLFLRKPTLHLSEAGKIMQKTLLEIQLQEKDMKEEILSLNHGISGTYSIGMNHTRTQILVPQIFPKFHECFPNIQLNVQFGETAKMEDDLVNGRLNCFVGVNTKCRSHFRVSPICNDSLYVIASSKTLREHFGSDFDRDIRDLTERAELEMFRDIPLILQALPSTTAELINNYCSRKNIHPSILLEINNLDAQMRLCSSMKAITVCPSIFIGRVMDYNKTCDGNSKLYAFPIGAFKNALRVDMITPKHVKLSAWMSKLIELLREECLMFSYI